MHISDGHILKLLRHHEPHGMELLYKIYYRPLVLWADTFLDSIPAAEDLVQEYFVQFWEKESYMRITSANIRGYLFASIKKAALKYLEKKDPLRASGDIGNLVIEFIDTDDLTEEMLRQIRAEIEKLPPRTREVLKAVYVDGLRYKEVAERFAISIPTVKTLLVNALKRLRAVFSKFS